MTLRIVLSPELTLAIERAEAERSALGEWPSVERLIRIADNCGAHWVALLAATVRLLPEVDQVLDVRPMKIDLTGKLASLDKDRRRFNRAWVLADTAEVFAVLALGPEPHALVYNTAARPIFPREYRARSRMPEPKRPILRKPKATEVV